MKHSTTNLTRPDVRSRSLLLRPHLLVAESSWGPQGRCGSQTAQTPWLRGLRRLQGPPVDGRVWGAVVGGMGQCVVGRRQWHRLAVCMLAGWGDRMGGELTKEKNKKKQKGEHSPSKKPQSNTLSSANFKKRTQRNNPQIIISPSSLTLRYPKDSASGCGLAWVRRQQDAGGLKPGQHSTTTFTCHGLTFAKRYFI